jgi:hypothetical protein
MPETQYRLFFNNTAASDQQLERIDRITVEQEVDMAWEMRLKVPISVDALGNWTGEDEAFMRPFSRIRVEIKLGTAPFVPLFDGPVTGFDSQMSSQPDQSTITLIAQDDTFFMNRVEQVVAFENRLDHEVAEQIFGDYSSQVSSTSIDTTPASGSALDALVVQRGTAMDILRFLARRQGMHAYVLPGDNPGSSIGCFKAFPTAQGQLPALVLLGQECNVDSLHVRYCACKPSDASASTLRITDKQVQSETSRSSDAELMGDETGEDSSQAAMQLLLPQQGESVDLRQAVTARAIASSYAYVVNGKILEEKYDAVLQPYRVVTVRAGNSPVSGDYLITQTTHTITRSQYSQSFTLKRNARSSRFSAGQASVPGGIF